MIAPPRPDPDSTNLRRGLGLAAVAMVLGWTARIAGLGRHMGPLGRPWGYWAGWGVAAGLALALYAVPGYLAVRRRERGSPSSRPAL